MEELLRDVPPERLDQPCTDKHLNELALSVTEWHSIAPFLGVDQEAIQVRNPHDVKAQKMAMLRMWKERLGSTATYRRLAEVFWKVEKTILVEEVRSLLEAEPSGCLPPQPESDRPNRVGTASASVQPGK